MGKAQRYKEQRRTERATVSAGQARRSHVRRWLVGLGAFAFCAALLFPWIDHRFAHDAARKALSKPVATKTTPAASPAANQSTNNPEAPVSKQVVQVHTEKGDITMELYPDKAPKTVEHITALIKSGFYNGLTFHRVEPGFVIQGGDPKGDGSGGSGKNVPFETNDLKHDKGVVALARSQSKDSGDSQFYITLAPQPSLNGDYCVFGRVTAGQEVVDKIQKGDKMLTVTLPG